MFELGSSLREARVRRGVELAQVAAETRIRTRYLQALEDERFELLPGSVYGKGFVRAYADYLGLGRHLFEGTLEPGESRRFADGPFWIRIGAPWNLEASLAGRRLSLPQRVATVVVTGMGIRRLAIA